MNPGDGSNFVSEKDYLNPKCPHAVSNWRVFSQVSGETLDDPTFKIECVVGKLLYTDLLYLYSVCDVKIVQPQSPQLLQDRQ